jgi:DNA-directed RNA polymerase subunit RPC12/RpoP
VTPAERARELLDSARTRGDIKRLAASLEDDPVLRRAVFEEGRRRGAPLPDDALEWPAKRLLRVARARETESRARSNPIARDEAFTCAHCGASVLPHGRTARDHCPHCLHSLHVDEVPGDRASTCGGLLVPIGMELREGHPQLRYRCARCGASRTNQALLDGDPADDWELVVALSARAAP